MPTANNQRTLLRLRQCEMICDGGKDSKYITRYVAHQLFCCASRIFSWKRCVSAWSGDSNAQKPASRHANETVLMTQVRMRATVCTSGVEA